MSEGMNPCVPVFEQSVFYGMLELADIGPHALRLLVPGLPDFAETGLQLHLARVDDSLPLVLVGSGGFELFREFALLLADMKSGSFHLFLLGD